VCVDGSPSAYYWREGDPGSSTWIVDLQGGGWCYGEASCRQRCAPGTTSSLCSSRAWPEERELGPGLLNPALHSALSGAHRAWVPYCTSDAHMGDAVAFGMQFRGARVLQAVLADLVQLGLGSESGRPLVILGGQSAGGRGAMVSLEYVRDMLGPELAQRVDVMGFLDSPLWVDVPPYSAHFVGFAAMCQGVFSYANVTRLGRRCEAAHPGSDRWKCIMGEYRMPHIRTPYLLVASQYDAFQLSENSISLPKDANETAYADSLANRTRDLMSTLRAGWQPGGLQNAVFSWTCHDHASSCSSRGFDRRTCGPDRVTLDAATLQFLGLEPLTGYPRTLEWIDSCSGINCGDGCGIGLERHQRLRPRPPASRAGQALLADPAGPGASS